MKLTEKDKAFLETLRRRLESRELSVELKPGRPSYLVLRGTYGEHIHEAFRMTRQGVRWRFARIMDQYISSFESLLFIERVFGTQLREHAMRISQERYALRQQVAENSFQTADSLAARRQTGKESADQRDRKM